MNHHDGQAETIRDSRASQLQSCRQRIALFKGLQIDNYEDRSIAVEKIIQVVKSYMRSSINSPDISAISPSLSDHSEDNNNSMISLEAETEYSKQLFYYLLTITRLSSSCPYADVRQTFKELLNNVSKHVSIPKVRHKSPSYFISLNDIFSLDSSFSSVIYPRSSNLSFSPWSYNSLNEEQQQEGGGGIEQAECTTPTTMKQLQKNDYTGGRPSDEYVRQMMIKTFIDEGRLANLYRVLSFFPTFFEIYHITYQKIIKGTMGPLNRTWKSYIGLMVSAEQKCQYLFSSMKMDFLYNGGDPNWLRGLNYVPNKLRHLSLFILKLSRQPWQLNHVDIQHLLSGSVGDNWTRGELVQVTLIISTFLGLSTFILGCGITPEIDMTGGFYDINDYGGIENELDLPSLDQDAINAACHATGWQQEDEEQGQEFTVDYGLGLGLSTTPLIDTTEELISKLKQKKVCTVKEQLLDSLEKMNIKNKISINTSIYHSANEEDQEEVQRNSIHDDFNCFIDASLNKKITYETFQHGHEEYLEFMLGEYCWEDHGCDLVNHYLPGIGDDLVAEFTEAISITDWSIFHPVVEDVVDTSPLRYAIWYYTQKMMGVTKEDYTYSDIPTYLNDRTTKYIHSLALVPHTIQKSDWCNIGISLRPEEKCHVNLLIASARKQAVLCYGLCLISEV